MSNDNNVGVASFDSGRGNTIRIRFLEVIPNEDLSDKKKDFIYKDQVLEDDILKGIVIKSDTQKEKLTIIAQNK